MFYKIRGSRKAKRSPDGLYPDRLRLIRDWNLENCRQEQQLLAKVNTICNALLEVTTFKVLR